VTASLDLTRFHGPVKDVVLEAEDQLIKDNANQLIHVSDQDNITVSGIPNIVVLVEHAHQELDMSSELTEAAVIESDKLVIVSPDSTKTHGNVLDVHLAKEDLLIRDSVNHLPNVSEISNILVSTILRAAVFVEHAHKELDG